MTARRIFAINHILPDTAFGSSQPMTNAMAQGEYRHPDVP